MATILNIGSAMANTPIPVIGTIIEQVTVDIDDTDVNIVVFVPAYTIFFVTLSASDPFLWIPPKLITFFNGIKNAHKNAIAATTSCKKNTAI